MLLSQSLVPDIACVQADAAILVVSADYHLCACVQADVAILVVSAQPSEFTSGWRVAKEQVQLTHALGMWELIVCVNKMDRCGYSAERFYEVRYRRI